MAQQRAALQIAPQIQMAHEQRAEVWAEIPGAGSHENAIHICGTELRCSQRVARGKARQVHGRLAVARVQLVRGLVRRKRVRIRPEMAVLDVAIQKNLPDARAGVTQQAENFILGEAARRDGRSARQYASGVQQYPQPPTFSLSDAGYGTRGSIRKLAGKRGDD